MGNQTRLILLTASLALHYHFQNGVQFKKKKNAFDGRSIILV
jgi:hypothetical protein